MITVSKLIELLSQFPDDTPVVMAGDSEGNTIKPLEEIELNKGYVDGYEVELIHPDDYEECDVCGEVVSLWPGYPCADLKKAIGEQ